MIASSINAAALASGAVFLASWLKSNLDIFSRLDRKTWWGAGAVWAGVTLFRNAALPLESYQPWGHDRYLARLLTEGTFPANPESGFGRLYVMALFAAEKIKVFLSIGPEGYPLRAVRWPALSDFFVAVFIICFLAINRRTGVRPFYSLSAILLVLLHPTGLFFASVLTDHWISAFVLAWAAFHVHFELKRVPFRPGVFFVATAASALTAFYFKYFALVLIPPAFLAVARLRQSVGARILLVTSLAGVFGLLCVFDLWPWLMHVRANFGRLTESGVPYYFNYSLLRIPAYWSFESFYRFVHPFGTAIFLLVFAFGARRAIRESEKLDPVFLLAFGLVCVLFPFGFFHPGDRLFLPLIFFSTPFLGLGLQELAAEGNSTGSVRFSGWRAIAGKALVVIVAGQTAWAAYGLSQRVFRRDLVANEFTQWRERLPVWSPETFTARLNDSGAGRTVHLLTDNEPWTALVNVDSLSARVVSHSFPVSVNSRSFRENPTYALLEWDAYQWNTRLRRDYRILLEAEFHLEPLAVHSVTDGLIFRLRPKKGR